MTIRAVIVEDERLARERLKRMLREHADIELAGEAGDGAAGLDLIRRISPEVVFLDIQMPRLSGFDMLAKLDESPYIIFTTAYDEHALRAFEENAVDYLLKPISRDGLERALEKIRRILCSGRSLEMDLEKVRVSLERAQSTLRRFSIASGKQIVLAQDHEVEFFHAEDKYTLLHLGGKSHIVPFTIKELEERLDADRFLRVHRSYIVNLDRIRSVQRWIGGRLIITLQSGREIPVSRNYTASFRRRINL